MKPDISLDQLPGATPGLLDDLLEGHEELVDAYLSPGRSLGAEAAKNGGSRVLGVGVTEHVVNGKPTGEPAVLMLVDRITGGGRGFPARTGRGAPILVEEVGEIRPLAGYRDCRRPVQAGVSIAPCARNYAGTLGCMVSCNGVNYLLSNNHVLADVNSLAPGATISQPAIQDGGSCPPDVIGALAYVLPIVIGGVSAADAALASIAAGVSVDPRILRDNGVTERMIAPIMRPLLNLNVQKSGRTTGWTRGARVQSIGLTLVINFGSGTSSLSNMFATRASGGRFAVGGDSGAVITTDPGNQPVGLLTASDSIGTTYASGLSDVLTALATLTGAQLQVVY